MKRPLWRSIWDAAKFFAVLVVVLLVLQRFGVVDILPGHVTVIDGDSLREGQTEIRLHGIDAPEYRQTCTDSNGAEYACGKRAAEVLRNITKQGELICQRIEIDRYGRAVSNCKIGTLDVNHEMVARGWAVAFFQYGTPYVLAENTARQHKLGLWAGKFEAPANYRQRQRNLSGNITGMKDLQPD
jgi:endonuclease YncB( thermonuclease family)